MKQFLLWFVWVLELGLFIFGAGCVFIAMGAGLDWQASTVIGLVILVAAVVLCGYGVFKGAAAIHRGSDSRELGLLLSLPALAIFIFSGGCVIMLYNA